MDIQGLANWTLLITPLLTVLNLGYNIGRILNHFNFKTNKKLGKDSKLTQYEANKSVEGYPLEISCM